MDRETFAVTETYSITKLDNATAFIGFYPTSLSASSVSIEVCRTDYPYFHVSTINDAPFGACCINPTSCRVWQYTSSISGTVWLGASPTSAISTSWHPCSSSSTPYAWSLYSNSEDMGVPTQIFLCGTDVSTIPKTLWRTVLGASETTSSSTGTATSTTQTPATSGTSSVPTTTPLRHDNDSSSSKVWIVGAVLGPIAACALIGFLALFLARRKSRTRQGGQMSQGTSPHQSDPMVAAGTHDFNQPVLVRKP